MKQLNRRKNIYHAAAKLFFTKGYCATTMREIARAVKVESPALYYYYPSKQSLLYEILKKGTQDLMDRADAEVESAENTTEKVRAFLISLVSYVLKRKEEAGLLNEERNLNRKRRNELRQASMEYVNKFERLLSMGIREKVFYPCDSKITAILILNSAVSISQWYRRDGSITADEIAKIFADRSIRSLLRNS